jgi:alpha-N-arabinofuranosidase
VLRAEIDGPSYDARYYDPRGSVDHYYPISAPYLKVGAVQQDDGGITVFAINRSLDEAMPLEIVMSGFGAMALIEAQVLRHDDLTAVNTADDPDKVMPVPLSGVAVAGERATASLPPASWSVLRLRAPG